MSDFHEKLKEFIDSSTYDYKSLSLKIGQGERYISNLLNAKSDPSFETVVRICATLNITPNQLLGIGDQLSIDNLGIEKRLVAAQAEKLLSAVTREAHARLTSRGIRPTVDDVLHWWHRNNGQLKNFRYFEDHVDLFLVPPPDAKEPISIAIGEFGLIGQTLDIKSPADFRRILPGLGESALERVVQSHHNAAKNSPVLTVETMEFWLPGQKFPNSLTYKRLLLKVETHNQTLILNYAQAFD